MTMAMVRLDWQLGELMVPRVERMRLLRTTACGPVITPPPRHSALPRDHRRTFHGPRYDRCERCGRVTPGQQIAAPTATGYLCDRCWEALE